MKIRAVTPVIALSLIVCGCSTSPQSTSSAAAPHASAPQTASVAAQPTPPPVAPESAPTPAPVEKTELPKTEAPVVAQPAPKLSPEAAAIIDRLTNPNSDALQHDIAKTSAFAEARKTLQPGAPAPKFDAKTDPNLPPSKGLTADGSSTSLIERDWTGIVLVPVETALSKAYTSSVRLLRVEAHPLTDGRIRVWARVQNISGETLSAEIACAFRATDPAYTPSPYFYELKVPGNTVRDVFFVSPEAELLSYTTLVRDTRALKNP